MKYSNGYKIRTIDLFCKFWSDQSNTYFTYYIVLNFGMKGEQTIIQDRMETGGADHCKQQAFEKLIEMGYFQNTRSPNPSLKHITSTIYYRENNIIFRFNHKKVLKKYL